MNWTGTRYNVLEQGRDQMIAYSNGPIKIGQYPMGYQYTGYWAAYLDFGSNQIFAQPVSYIAVPPVSTSTGTTKLNFFPGVTAYQYPSNLSLTFDNSGQFFLGIQDNSTSPPTIKVAGTSGNYTAQWNGYNPLVFNGVEIFTGYYASGGSLSAIRTGTVGCFYTNSSKDQYFARYQSDNFTNEYPFSFGGTTGYFYWIAGMTPSFFVDGSLPTGYVEPYDQNVEQGIETLNWDLLAFEVAVSGLSLVTAYP